MNTHDVLVLISKALEPNILDGSIKQMDYEHRFDRLTIITSDGSEFIIEPIRI